MKKLLLALALFLIPSLAWAQCNGVFPNNTVCGNITGANNTPRPTPPTSFQGSAGGTNGQVQYNCSGALCGENQVTTTQGGTGADNSTNTANDILVSNGTNGTFVHRTLTTVLHAVCTLSPSTCGYILGYYSADWFGVIGYAPTNLSTTGCASGSAGGPDDTTALTTAINQPFKVKLPSNRCYKITQWSNATTSGGGLYGDRSATVWMPAASFNNTTPSSTLNPLASNALGFYLQGQLTTPFTSAFAITLDGFRIISEVSDGRAVGAIAIRNCTNCAITNMEIAGFPVGAAVYADTLTNFTFTGNYIHDITSNLSVWGATSVQIMGLAIDGSRVNGVGSRYNHIQNNFLQNIVFTGATTAQQQSVGLGVFTLGGVGEHVITGNIINNTGECIDNYSTNSVIVGNNVETCLQGGINIKHQGSFNTLSHNVIRASGLYGITLSGDTVATTAENLVDANTIIGLDPLAVNSGLVTACIRFNDNGATFHSTLNMLQNNYCDASGGKYGYYGDASDGQGNYYQNNFASGYSVQFQFFGAGTAQQWGTFSVAQLNATGLACTGSTRGLQFIVGDLASAPAYLSNLPGSGGGTVAAAYRCNGTNYQAGG